MYLNDSFNVKQNKKVYAWAYFTKNEDTKTAECRICFKVLKLGQYAYNGLNGHLEGQHGITISNYMLNFNRIEELRLGKILVYESNYEMHEGGRTVPQVIEKKFGSKQQRSYVWNFCVKRNESISTCKLCLKHIKCGNSPKPLKMHLRNKHDVHEGNHELKFVEFSSQLNNALNLLGTFNSSGIIDEGNMEYTLNESFEEDGEGLLKINEMNTNFTNEKTSTDKLKYKNNNTVASTTSATQLLQQTTSCKISPDTTNSVCKISINNTCSPNQSLQNAVSISKLSSNNPPPNYELAVQQQQNCFGFKEHLPLHFSMKFFHFHGRNNSTCKICHKPYKVGKGSNKKLITHLWADHGIMQDNFKSSMHLIERYDSKLINSDFLLPSSDISNNLFLLNSHNKSKKEYLGIESCLKNSSGSTSKYSYVWNFFETPINGFAKCKVCFKSFTTVKNGFIGLVVHLKQNHDIDNENSNFLDNENFYYNKKKVAHVTDNENVEKVDKPLSNEGSPVINLTNNLGTDLNQLNSSALKTKEVIPEIQEKNSPVDFSKSNEFIINYNKVEEPIEVQMLDSDSDEDLNQSITFQESKDSQASSFQPLEKFEKPSSLSKNQSKYNEMLSQYYTNIQKIRNNEKSWEYFFLTTVDKTVKCKLCFEVVGQDKLDTVKVVSHLQNAHGINTTNYQSKLNLVSLSVKNPLKNPSLNGNIKTTQLSNKESVATSPSLPLLSNATTNSYQFPEDLSNVQSFTKKQSFVWNFFSEPGLFGFSKCYICGKSIKKSFIQHLKIHSIYESNYTNKLNLKEKVFNCHTSNGGIDNSEKYIEENEMNLYGSNTAQAVVSNCFIYSSYVWKFFEHPLNTHTICKLCQCKINFKTSNLNLLKNHLAYKHKINKNNYNKYLYLLSNNNITDQRIKDNTNGVVLSCNDDVCKLITECSLSFSQIVSSTVFEFFFLQNNLPKDVNSLRVRYMNIYDKAVANFFWNLVKEKKKEQKFSLDLSLSHKLNGRTYIVISLHYSSTFQILRLIQIYNKPDVDDIQSKIYQTLDSFGLEYSKDIVSITTNITPLMKKIGLKVNVIHQICICSLVSFVVKDLVYNAKTSWIVHSYKSKVNPDDVSSLPMDQYSVEEIISILSSSELKVPFVSVLSKIFTIMNKYKKLFLENYSKNKEVINITTIPFFFQQMNIFLTDTRRWQCLHRMINCFINNQESIFDFLKENNEVVYISTYEQCTIENLCTLLEYADDITTQLDDSEITSSLSYADKHMKKLFTSLQVERTGILSIFYDKLLRAYCGVRNTTLLHLIEFLEDPDFVLRSVDDFGFDVSFRSVILLGSELLENLFKSAVEKYKASMVVQKCKVKSLDSFLQKIRQQNGENQTSNFKRNKLEKENSESSNQEEDHVAQIFQSYADTKLRPKLLCLLQTALQTVQTSSFPSQQTFASICNLTSYREDAFTMREVNAIMFMRSYYKNFDS